MMLVVIEGAYGCWYFSVVFGYQTKLWRDLFIYYTTVHVRRPEKYTHTKILKNEKLVISCPANCLEWYSSDTQWIMFL